MALGLPRSTANVVALFAVLRAGAAYVPLELDHPDERLAEILDASGAALCGHRFHRRRPLRSVRAAGALDEAGCLTTVSRTRR
ncbi:AMP-binding protein [Pseudonocardia sp. ICBG601]|uniref:AMP-binding protein n=1 Tax=Pseudonocardia sp. ICBG601 TaxID=2846759 RepID=UPI0035ABA0A8